MCQRAEADIRANHQRMRRSAVFELSEGVAALHAICKCQRLCQSAVRSEYKDFPVSELGATGFADLSGGASFKARSIYFIEIVSISIVSFI